jgi:hypothetical protein
MRDPDRIPLVLGALERAWREHPQQRLGQLFMNAVGTEDLLFYVEDDELIASLSVELTETEEAFIQDEPERRQKEGEDFITEAQRYFGLTDPDPGG